MFTKPPDDLEDYITVVHARQNIASEVDAAPAGLRLYVVTSIRNLMENTAFQEALPGDLPADAAI